MRFRGGANVSPGYGVHGGAAQLEQAAGKGSCAPLHLLRDPLLPVVSMGCRERCWQPLEQCGVYGRYPVPEVPGTQGVWTGLPRSNRCPRSRQMT